MRRSTKVKVAVACIPLRKATRKNVVPVVAQQRGVPVRIDAVVSGPGVSATSVTPRVRDGLVLRVVGLKKSNLGRNLSHGSAAR